MPTLLAVIDTNVWVSSLINPAGPPARVTNAWRQGQFGVVTSGFLLDELRQVLLRPRLQRLHGLTLPEVDQYIASLAALCIRVEPARRLNICRDRKDDLVLETALTGRAGYVVSRDDDIKDDADVVKQMSDQGVSLVSVQQFLNILDQRRADLI